MSGKRIKNNDIKNILNDNDNTNENSLEKEFLFKPILNLNKENHNYKKYNNKIFGRNKNIIEKIINREIKSSKYNYLPNNKENIKYFNKDLNNKTYNKQKIKFNSAKTRNNNINTFNKNKNKKNLKSTIHQPFVTSMEFKNIQTNEEESKIISPKYKSKKNNLDSFGKSLNQILINTINEAIMKNGNIIKKKKRKNFSAIIYNKDKYKNFNNYDLHSTIFDDKLIEIFEDYQKKQKLYKKQRLNHLLPDLEEKGKKIISRIPLSIKAYKKNDIDIFYTRNICDLDYQKYYMKEKINMNDILENHNIYNRKDYLSAKVPFFMLTKSVVKPICKKSSSQNNIFSRGFKNISF